MIYLNLRTSILRHPNYIGSEPTARATWFNVLAFCCEQENGGRIVGARKWKDRQWQQTCGVFIAEVDASSPLLIWDGEDLIVWEYPVEKEAEVQSRREAGRLGGKQSGKARAKHPTKQNRSTASSTPLNGASTEGNGMEGNGKKETSPLPPSSTAGVKEGTGKKLLPTTDQSKRIATLFHRRLTTQWSDDEYKAYRAIGTVPEEDLAALEAYYGDNWPPQTGVNILRHDLQTLLNNFSGEVDRAKMHLLEKRGPKEQVPAAFRTPMNAPPTRPEGV